MNWNTWIRQTHRWLSIAFTVALIANLVVMGQGELAVWVGLLTLLPLALLLLTGSCCRMPPVGAAGDAPTCAAPS